MKSWFYLVLWVQILFSKSILAASLEVLKPTEDNFYNITSISNLVSAKEGTILKMRRTPHKVRSIYFPINVKDAWQVLVKSTDSQGNATAIVATIFEPYNADSSKLLSYQTAEDSASPNCAPSYGLLQGASMATVVTQAEMLVMGVALKKGWYVITPDYEGPKAGFGAGVQSGKATLDGIRAALSTSNTTGIHKDAKVAMFGYSGGSFATGWATQLQPTYAKELKANLIGSCMGGFVNNFSLTLDSLEGTIYAGLIPNIISGLSNVYPEVEDAVQKHLIKNKTEKFDASYDYCLLTSVIHNFYSHFFEGPNKVFDTGYDILTEPAVKDIFDENTIAFNNESTLPEIPVFVFHGTQDTIVPFSGSERVYENWCGRGIKSFEFAVDKTSGHLSEIVQGIPAGIAWLEKTFNGTKPYDGCSRTERQTNFEYPGTDRAIFDFLEAAAALFLGFDIGPNDGNLTVPKYFKSIGSTITSLAEAIF